MKAKIFWISRVFLGLIILGNVLLYMGCTNTDERMSLPITDSNVDRVKMVLADSSNFNAHDWAQVMAFHTRYECALSELIDDVPYDLWDMLEIEHDTTFLIGKTISEIIEFEKEAEKERILLDGVSSEEILLKSREINSISASHRVRYDSLESLISVEMVDARIGRVFSTIDWIDVEIRLRVSNNGARDIRNYSLHASLEHPSFGGDHEKKYLMISDESSVLANSDIVIDGSITFTYMAEVEDFMSRPLDEYVFDSDVSEIEFTDGELIEKYEDSTSELQEELCRMI